MPTYGRTELDAHRSQVHAARNQTPTTWATSVLSSLGIRQSPGAVQALVGWARAEGGHWNNSAKYNPLNTTQPEPGAGNTGTQGNIKVYTSWDQGVKATVDTLRNGRYGGILSALKSGDPAGVANAIGQTPWGTSASLVKSAIMGTPAPKAGELAAPAAPTKTYGVTTATPGKAPTLTPGSTETDTKGAVTAALLDKRKGMSLVSRMQEAVASGKFTTTTLPKATAGTAPKYSVGSAQGASAASGGGDAKARADTIDAKKLPYKWGGGHGGKVNPATASPLDCSGAVSAVLGLNPRVASQFKAWGKAGDGGNKGVTVYAKDTHVLMKINGHFWGTSGSNPGGGAGWIKQKDISPSYLAGFTARHQ